MIVSLLLVVALLFLSAVFSGSETGLYSLNRVRLATRLQAQDTRARWLQILLHPVGRSIIAILIANNVVNQLLAIQVERGFYALTASGWSVVLTTVVLTPLVLVFGEFLPKQFFRMRADTVMDRIALLLVGIRRLLWPAVMLIEVFIRLLQRLLAGHHPPIWEPYTSRQNLRTFFRAQQTASPMTEIQRRMVDRILALERLKLSYEGVSKPLSGIASFDADMSVGQVRAQLGPKFYQRYLIRRQGKPCGYVSAATLAIADPARPVGELTEHLPSLPVDLPLHEAIQRMHADGSDLALVTDRFGRPIRIAFRNDALRVLANLEG